MPINDQAFLNDLSRLRALLDSITSSSATTADALREVAKETKAIELNQFRSEQQLRSFIERISQIGVSAKLSAVQLRELNRVAREIAAFGNFSPKKGSQTPFPGENITLGRADEVPTLPGGGTDFEKILGQPGTLEKLPGGARALENIKKQLNGFNAELSDLSEIYVDSSRGTVRWTANITKIPGVVNRATFVTDRWGGILKSTQKQFRSFGSAVVRDIGEIVKWGIAAAVVYAPIRALGDLIRETTELQNRLADAQIALGASQETLNVVWEDAAKVARELGVDVSGVVEGYVLAFRATGNITNPTERANKATALLRDSMLLAKLASIDQAQALDTLVGALRQTNTPMDEGVTILDKWVAVSKVANVSVATLAESFAITATAAENVGLSIDELNGFIAAVAEVTTLSATESGNAVRAFISGFQTQRAEDQLRRFGISVRDVQGDLRAFSEVVEDIVSRRDVGLISDRELAKIAEVIGGGARRGAQVNAFLRNYSRVQDLAAVSAAANGDAADALGIKLDTLQSALVNMKNAFSELARATGSEGGFLELITLGVEGLTSFADILNRVISLLGSATPALVGLTVAMIAFANSSRLQSLAGGLLGRAIIPAQQGGGQQTVDPKFAGVGVPPLQVQRPQLGIFGRAASRLGVGRGTTFGDLARTGTARAAGGAGVGALLALGDVTGEDKNLARAGATVGLAMGGALIAGPAGALVGAAISQAFIADLEVNAASIALTMARAREGTLGVSVELEPGDVEGVTQEIERVMRQVFGGFVTDTFLQHEIGFQRGNIAAAAGVADPSALSPQQVTDLVQEEIIRILAGEEPSVEIGGRGVSRSIFDTAFDAGEANAEIREQAQEILKALEAGLEAEAQGSVQEFTGIFNDLLNASLSRTAPITSELFKEELTERRTATGRGELGVRQLREFQSLQASIGNQTNLIATALQSVIGERLTEVDLIALILDLEEEERNLLVDTANEIGRAIEEAGKLVDVHSDDLFIIRATADAQSEVVKLTRQLNDETLALASTRIYRDFEPANIFRLDEDVTDDQLEELVRATLEAQDQVVDALTLDPSEREKIFDSYEEVAFRIGDLFDDIRVRPERFDVGILSEIAKAQGLDFEKDSQLPIQVLDITLAEFEAALVRLPFFENLVRQLRPLEDEILGFITEDDQTKVIAHTDSLAIQLLMRDLVALNEDQLEGIFNIPDGVVASIPFTGQLFFSTEPINRQDITGLTTATGDVESAIDEQTTTLHNDLLALLPEGEEIGPGGAGSATPRGFLGGFGSGSQAGQGFVDEVTTAIAEATVAPDINPFAGTGRESTPLVGPSAFDQWLQDTGLSGFIESLGSAFDSLVNAIAPSTVGQFPEVGPQEPRFDFEDDVRQPFFNRFDDGLGQEPGTSDTNIQDLVTDVFRFIKDSFVLGVEASELGPQRVDPRSITGTLGLDNLGGGIKEILEATLPQSIPVTVNTRITSPITILVDGRLIQQAVEERSFQDLGSATRRAGALGFVQE